MNLKQLLKRLDALIDQADNLMIRDVSREFNSYRGYYDQLAMAKSDGRAMSAVEFSNVLFHQIGCTYYGYKGGDFLMGSDTELFVADYGRCGEWVTGVEIDEDGRAYLVTSKKDYNGLSWN